MKLNITFLAFIFPWTFLPYAAMAFQASDKKSETIHVEAIDVTTVADGIDSGTGGLAVDKDGNLYTADFGWKLNGSGKGGDKIFKVTPDGKVSLFCRQMRGASGNNIDAKGNLYQSSIGGNFVSKVTPDGKVTVVCKTGLQNPVGIAIGENGELFVCNCGNNSIQKITPDGKSTRFSTSPLYRVPNGICRGPDGTLYVCNFGNGDVIKVNKEGKASRLATLPGGNNGHLTYYANHLFVISRGGHSVIKVGLDGKATYFAGSGKRGKKDGSPSECQFSLPNSIFFSPDHKFLYVNETSPTSGDQNILGPTRIRRIKIKTTVGGPPPKERMVAQPDPKIVNRILDARQKIGLMKFDEAIKILNAVLKDSPQNMNARYMLGYAFHASKMYQQARDQFEKTIASNQYRVPSLYNIACSHALENNADKAFAFLDKAIKAGYKDFNQMKNDTDFANIKDDPRFKKLIGD